MDLYRSGIPITVDPAPARRAVANLPARGSDVELRKAVGVFLAQRTQLLKIAYRILGSVEDAEDVVQETWIRWQRTDRDVVDNPAAFLATATSRLAINVLQSANTRHETAVTRRWFEDIADSATPPETTAERTEAVERALHVLLERLGPRERAAYILRNGFGYSYRRVAAVLNLSSANVRQLVSRARPRIQSSPRRPASLEPHRRMVRAFITAARIGELGDLEVLLAAGIGGKQPDRHVSLPGVISGDAVRSYQCR